MRSRRATNIDADSRIMEALEAEARSRAQIDQDEDKQRLLDLPHPIQPVSYWISYKDYTNIMKDHIYER